MVVATWVGARHRIFFYEPNLAVWTGAAAALARIGAGMLALAPTEAVFEGLLAAAALVAFVRTVRRASAPA